MKMKINILILGIYLLCKIPAKGYLNCSNYFKTIIFW